MEEENQIKHIFNIEGEAQWTSRIADEETNVGLNEVESRIQKKGHTINLAPKESPSLSSIEPTTLKHCLADCIVARDKPVNFAISSSSGYLPWVLYRKFRAFFIWFIDLLKEAYTKIRIGKQ